MQQSICPCGLIIESDNIGIDKNFNASFECLKLQWKLSAYTLSLRDNKFPHQYVVDAYAAQHASIDSKPIRIAFSLIGIYLALEHGYTGREVQLAHISLARKSKSWPKFITPRKKADMTVQDVVNVNDNLKHEQILKWMKSVWDIWGDEHKNVEELVNKYIDLLENSKQVY